MTTTNNKTSSKSQIIKLDVNRGTPFSAVEENALRAIVDVSPGDLSMVGWYDLKRRTGGPMEPCGGESIKCARDYARSHGAEYTVKTEIYELFFSRIPKDAAQLDPAMVHEVHRGLEKDRYDNVQGGWRSESRRSSPPRAGYRCR